MAIFNVALERIPKPQLGWQLNNKNKVRQCNAGLRTTGGAASTRRLAEPQLKIWLVLSGLSPHNTTNQTPQCLIYLYIWVVKDFEPSSGG
jgi:hypothetical protein